VAQATSEAMRITPATYGQIARTVSGENIECGGERIPINHDNAARIRQAVELLRRAAKLPLDCPASIQIPWRVPTTASPFFQRSCDSAQPEIPRDRGRYTAHRRAS